MSLEAFKIESEVPEPERSENAVESFDMYDTYDLIERWTGALSMYDMYKDSLAQEKTADGETEKLATLERIGANLKAMQEAIKERSDWKEALAGLKGDRAEAFVDYTNRGMGGDVVQEGFDADMKRFELLEDRLAK